MSRESVLLPVKPVEIENIMHRYVVADLNGTFRAPEIRDRTCSQFLMFDEAENKYVVSHYVISGNVSGVALSATLSLISNYRIVLEVIDEDGESMTTEVDTLIQIRNLVQDIISKGYRNPSESWREISKRLSDNAKFDNAILRRAPNDGPR